jgi:acyl-homoserine-lactone acylase
VEALTFASDWMLRHHKGYDVPFAQVQRHQRGRVSYGLAGGVETLTPVFSKFDEKAGNLRPFAGDSYFGMVQWKDGQIVRMESITPYGSSGHPDSPHYTDQMELFANQKLKPVELERETILRNASVVYSPGQRP